MLRPVFGVRLLVACLALVSATVDAGAARDRGLKRGRVRGAHGQPRPVFREPGRLPPAARVRPQETGSPRPDRLPKGWAQPRPRKSAQPDKRSLLNRITAAWNHTADGSDVSVGRSVKKSVSYRTAASLDTVAVAYLTQDHWVASAAEMLGWEFFSKTALHPVVEQKWERRFPRATMMEHLRDDASFSRWLVKHYLPWLAGKNVAWRTAAGVDSFAFMTVAAIANYYIATLWSGADVGSLATVVTSAMWSGLKFAATEFLTKTPLWMSHESAWELPKAYKIWKEAHQQPRPQDARSAKEPPKERK